MSYIGGSIFSTQEEDKEREERLDKIQNTVTQSIVGLLPDLTDPKETTEYFTDLSAEITKPRLPAKSLAIFAGKRLMADLPVVRRAVSAGKEIITPAIQKTKAFLEKDRLEPVYTAIENVTGIKRPPTSSSIFSGPVDDINDLNQYYVKGQEFMEELTGLPEGTLRRELVTADEAKYLEDKIVFSGANASETDIIGNLYPDLKTRKRGFEREKLLSTEGTELRELIIEHQQALATAEKVNIYGKEFSVAPYSLEEMTEKVKRYAALKEQLGIKNATSYTDDLGAFIMKDGSVARLNSKGELVSTKGLLKRLATQESFPTDKEIDEFVSVYGNFKDNKRRALSNLKNPELHHQVVLENQYGVLGKKLNKAGEFEARDPKFMRKVTEILKKRGHDLGDVNKNLLTMSEYAHRVGELSPHVTLQSATDFAKPHTYYEADQIFTTLTDGTQKWLDVERKGKSFILKDGDKVIPNKLIKSKGNYKVHGREFDKTQKQGLSLDTRKMLGSIDDPEQLADAYELFALDSGAKEMMEGAAALGSYAYDKTVDLDALTSKLRKEARPSMIKYINMLLKRPQYKNHQGLKRIKSAVQSSMALEKKLN